MITVQRITWLGACAVVFVDQVVCSPVVLQDLESLDILWEAWGRRIVHNFLQWVWGFKQ
jgi:hypothetical protein